MKTSHGNATSQGSEITEMKLNQLFGRILRDAQFRGTLEADPKAALANEGIDVTNPSVLSYLQQNIKADDMALLADGQARKVFAVLSSVSIVGAVSTPAFPKGGDTTSLK